MGDRVVGDEHLTDALTIVRAHQPGRAHAQARLLRDLPRNALLRRSTGLQETGDEAHHAVLLRRIARQQHAPVKLHDRRQHQRGFAPVGEAASSAAQPLLIAAVLQAGRRDQQRSARQALHKRIVHEGHLESKNVGERVFTQGSADLALPVGQCCPLVW